MMEVGWRFKRIFLHVFNHISVWILCIQRLVFIPSLIKKAFKNVGVKKLHVYNFVHDICAYLNTLQLTHF